MRSDLWIRCVCPYCGDLDAEINPHERSDQGGTLICSNLPDCGAIATGWEVQEWVESESSWWWASMPDLMLAFMRHPKTEQRLTRAVRSMLTSGFDPEITLLVAQGLNVALGDSLLRVQVEKIVVEVGEAVYG